MTRTKVIMAAGFALILGAGTLAAGAGLAAQAADPAPGGARPLRIAATAPGQDRNDYHARPWVVTARTAPPAQIRALAAGYNRLVTNGPIPDTPENRARYGKPLSHAGRQSAPDGN